MISLDSVQSAPVFVHDGAVDFVSWIARGRNQGSNDMHFLRLNCFCHVSFPPIARQLFLLPAIQGVPFTSHLRFLPVEEVKRHFVVPFVCALWTASELERLFT